jgi:uncharacterized protein (TIGR02145 family)
MKNIYYTGLILLASLAACEQEVKFVTPTWARAIVPEEGATVKIDFFKPDEMQLFSWEAREHSTYKIYFDIDMHFSHPRAFDMGSGDSLKITNEDLLEVLREVWPDFSSIKRFFWMVEQNTNGQISTTWRYFSAILAVESFEDARDGEKYEARQFVLKDGSLMTIMAENLRATQYADGSPLPLPYKGANTGDPVYDYKAGGYYAWSTAVNMTWDDARAAALENRPVQGICPDGWHLPSYAEFGQLREYLGNYIAGNEVKDPSYWKRTTTITNSSKLNIIASGYYWHEGVEVLSNGLDDTLPLAAFWSSSPYLKGMELAWGDKALDDDRNKAILMSLWDDAEDMFLQGYGIVPGVENRCYPVRCIMNKME